MNLSMLDRHLWKWVLGVLLLVVVFLATARLVYSQAEVAFPLAEPGPYATGYTTVDYFDSARQERKVTVRILYPAVQPAAADTKHPVRNAEPERSGAPYPLILTSLNDGTRVNWQLPSHGFVMAYPVDSYPLMQYDEGLVDFPRDLLFVLDQLAAHPPELLSGLIDTDHTGVLGYSWGGYGALAVSGVRADPAYYLSRCMNPALEALGYPALWNDYACALAADWDAFAAYVGPALTAGGDGLWPPITDERIRAVAPLAPEGALFFGPDGLAAADRPMLIMDGTLDTDCPYGPEAAFIFEHAGTPDKTLISFEGRDHFMIMSETAFGPMRHFVTAFFGEHLQGHPEYADFYSQAFVEQSDDLTWGVYTGS